MFERCHRVKNLSSSSTKTLVLVRHVVEHVGEVRGLNIDFQFFDNFRNLVHHVGHEIETWRPGRKSTLELATFWLTLCRSQVLHEGAEACSGLGLHEVHEALELNSCLMKMVKTFWTKADPPSSKKAVSRRRYLKKIKQLRSEKISKSSLPCRTRDTAYG